MESANKNIFTSFTCISFRPVENPFLLINKQNIRWAKMPILFVDLDGTLFDTSARFNQCLKEVGATDLNSLKGEQRRKFWECYQSPKYMNLDVPNQQAVDFVKRAKQNGWNVIILTGRNEGQKDATLTQLYNAGVPFDVLIMRKPNDFRKDIEYKGMIIAKFLNKDNDIMIVDDSEDIRGMLPSNSYSPQNLPQEIRVVERIPLNLPEINEAVVIVNPQSGENLFFSLA